ncbi:hypothetical protein MTO96_024303 [Rhipicephalus appendiculatus]
MKRAATNESTQKRRAEGRARTVLRGSQPNGPWTSNRNPAEVTDDANDATASEAKCASSPLCRHRGGAKRCDASSPFREADGRCNNLEHPEWGAAGACMRRLLPPAYADAFLVDKEGPEFSQNLGRDTYDCCGADSGSDPECFPIDVPAEDPFYSRYGVRCMNFKRSAPCLTCTMGHRDQVNFVTSYIDGSPVYGASENQTRGLLKEQVVNDSRLLPPSSQPHIDQCSKLREHRLCFEAGDRRINQNTGLTVMHTIWFREHNRVARELGQINPHWDDERLFQESRRIVEGRLQHIVYNELLEQILGPEGVVWYQLSPLSEGYTTYNATVDSTVYNEFTTAAFRLGHSIIDDDHETVYVPGEQILRLPLRLNWFNPFAFYDAGVMDAVTASRLRKPFQKMDRYGTHDVTRHAFRVPDGPKPYGVDLFAFDIQRGRDHGLRPYVDYVHHCAPDVRLDAFEHLETFMPIDAVELFAGLYE